MENQNYIRCFKEQFCLLFPIMKDIDFKDEGREYHFHEKVQAISLTDFQHYFSAAGLKLKQIFGDYHLNAFDIETSPRMIFILEK